MALYFTKILLSFLQDPIFLRASYLRKFRTFKGSQENKMHANNTITKSCKENNANMQK